MRPDTPWPPERVEMLRQLCETERWAKDIAAKLGVTRNAVIGKVQRMRRNGEVIGLKGVPGPHGQGGGRRRRHGKTQPNYAILASRPARPPAPKPTEPPCPELAVYSPRLLTLMELGPHHCRWPIGDAAPFLFCGAVAEPGFPYCHGHTRLARGGKP